VASDSVISSPKASSVSTPVVTSALLLVILLGILWGFKFGITSLFEAWQKPEYSHGYLIPFIAAFITLVRSRSMSAAHIVPSYVAPVIVLLIGLFFGAFGTLAAIPDIVTYGLIITLVALSLSIVGIKGTLWLWPALVYLVFMLPLPNFIYWPLSIKLQFLSSEIGVWLIKAFNIPVYLDGNIIDLGVYKLQVAEACSGLRYLFPLMSFGFLCAIFFNGPSWQKFLLFLSTIPITIGMNSVRIAVIGILVNSYGIEQAEGFLHFFEGWVVFIICLAILYVEALVFKRLSKKSGAQLFNLEFDGLRNDVKRFISYRASPALVAPAVILALASAAWSFGTTSTPAKLERQSFDQFPLSHSVWKGKRIFLEPDIERVLGADDYLFADFVSMNEPHPVNLLVSYYNSQTSGSGIHSPEVCIPGGGWEVSKWEQSQLSFGQQNFAVNRAIIQKGESRQLVYYWFEQRGKRLTSDYVAKAYTLWDSAYQGRSDGALVRVITNIDGKDIGTAEARLQRFVDFTIQELPRYVPQQLN
jgi:exosortase D (VPLPA-CTERM-specific)